jgi:hypothetical protein
VLPATVKLSGSTAGGQGAAGRGKSVTTEDGRVWDLPVTAEAAIAAGTATFACVSYSFATGAAAAQRSL